MLKFFVPFLFIALSSCGQTHKKHTVNPAAVALNNQIIPLVNYLNNDDSCKKALSFLDHATAIDSNYFLGYFNKLMFLYSLKQFDKAILIFNKLIELKPNAHDLYLMQGILYEKIQDPVSSKPCFQKSLAIANIVLDTMNVNNLNYSMLMGYKAIDLIMLGETPKANEMIEILKNAKTDEDMKQMVLGIINKNKKELLEYLTSNPNNH